ncbi:MAG: hypothetical protein JWR26_1860 [Pedosphaera sp.]|nr:hypothetical protein [Pedosphaera sp.]
MAKRSVFGLVKSETDASEIVEGLQAAGFSNTDISVLFPDKTGTKDFAHEKSTKAPEGATTGGGTGFVLGGALGWITGIGTLAIPGAGPFIAAGPILAALSGAAVGAAIGGIAGALIGMGIPEYEAKRYEGQIKDGNILISIHTEDSDQADHAKDILEHGGATDISSASEAAVKDTGNRAKTGTRSTTQTRTEPGGTTRTPKDDIEQE